jgi:hypothetical protein
MMFDQKVHDLYSVIESVAFHNYLEIHRSMLKIEHRYGEKECCCCGSSRLGCLIICVDCNKIWTRASRIDGHALDRMSERINEWLDQSYGEPQYSFQRFSQVCSAEIDRIFPERKNRDIDKLIRCLREIQKKKVMDYDFREIDDLIHSISQRWSIV